MVFRYKENVKNMYFYSHNINIYIFIHLYIRREKSQNKHTLIQKKRKKSIEHIYKSIYRRTKIYVHNNKIIK